MFKSLNLRDKFISHEKKVKQHPHYQKNLDSHDKSIKFDFPTSEGEEGLHVTETLNNIIPIKENYNLRVMLFSSLQISLKINLFFRFSH